jgi:hypothetical protein
LAGYRNARPRIGALLQRKLAQPQRAAPDGLHRPRICRVRGGVATEPEHWDSRITTDEPRFTVLDRAQRAQRLDKTPGIRGHIRLGSRRDGSAGDGRIPGGAQLRIEPLE